MEGLITVLWIGLGIAAGLSLAYFFFVFKRKKVIRNEVEIVMNQLKAVSKLVTVEGEFSEIYKHSDTSPVVFNFMKSEKKALVIVKAKVMMGYDLQKLKYKVNPQAKTIDILEAPKPEILSLSTDAEYYDIKNGTFNRFSKEELAQVKEDARQFMIEKIENSDLPQMVQDQSEKGIQLLENTTKSLGWELKA